MKLLIRWADCAGVVDYGLLRGFAIAGGFACWRRDPRWVVTDGLLRGFAMMGGVTAVAVNCARVVDVGLLRNFAVTGGSARTRGLRWGVLVEASF